MPGLFDDLMPAAKPAAAGGMFDDLMPQAVQTSAAPNLGTVTVGPFEPVGDDEVIAPDGEAPGVLRTLLGGLLDPFGSLNKAAGAAVDGARRADLPGAFRRGAAGAVAGGAHALGDFVDQTVQQGNPLPLILKAAGVTGVDETALRDPLGAKVLADEALGASREIGLDRQAAMQAIGAMPGLGDYLADPMAALGVQGERVATMGAESAPLFAAALATRNPAIGSGVIGSVTGGQTYTDLRGDGVDRLPAAIAGLGSGAVEAAGEGFGLERVMRPGAGGLAGAVLAEGGQEFPVELAQTALSDLATGKVTPIGEQLLGALEATMVGGTIGGAGYVASNAPAMLTRERNPREVAPVALGDAPVAAPAPVPQVPQVPPEANADLAPEDTSDIEALLLQNLPAIAEALGLGDIAPADVTPAAPATLESAPDPDARFRRPADTAAQAVQAPAEQSAPAPVGADLKLGEGAPRPTAPQPMPERAPEPAPESDVPPPDRLGEIDDTPDPPVDIKYGRKRKPPTAAEMAARDTALNQPAPAQEIAREAPTNDVLPAQASARPTPEATGGNLPREEATAEARESIDDGGEVARGHEAMDRVISEHADARDAMTRSGVGSVSFYWGKPGNPEKNFAGGSGIAKIIAKRTSEGADGESIARRMVDVIANGEVGEEYGPVGAERLNITQGGSVAVLSKYRFGDRETWLLTGWGEASDGGEGVNPSPAYAPESSGMQKQAGADNDSLAPPSGSRNSGDGLDSLATDREGRVVEQRRAGQSQREGEIDADRLGLRDAVAKVLGDSGSKVEYLRGYEGLPERLREGVASRNGVGRQGVTAALYDTTTGGVYLFTDVVTDPTRGAWHAAHEIAGHDGLRKLLGDGLDKALDLALQNPTVKQLADVIAAQRKLKPAQRLIAAEEALAELAAAIRTGNYDHITERYNIAVPAGIRSRVKAAIDNFLRRLKALFDRKGAGFNDAQVRELLESAWQAAKGDASTSGATAESVAEQTETPAFQRWFKQSRVTMSSGRPRPVYHGTAAEFWSFDKSKLTGNTGHMTAPFGFYFAENEEKAQHYAEKGAQGVPADERVVDVFLSIQNPKAMTLADFMDVEDFEQASKLRKQAERDGFDGIHVPEIGQWIAFEPNQIKSASENRGGFDAGTDDIRFSVVDYTPEQVDFMRKAGLSGAVDTRTSLQRVTDWALGKKPDIDGDSLIQSTLDQFHGIKRAVNEKGVTDSERNAYLAARQIQTGSTMEAILLYGAPKLEGGALRVNRDVPGLLQALGPVGKTMPQFLGWMVAVRARALKKQGRENLMSDADIAAGLALAKGYEAEFKQAAGDYLRLKNAILDLAEQTGTIDPAARAMWDSAEYIPFYREKEGASAGPGTRQGLANQSSGIRKLRGGESALTDPLANIIQNFTRLVDSAMKNRATLLAVDTLGEPYFRKAALAMKAEVIPLDQVKKHLIATGTDPATVDALPDAALQGVAKMLAVKAPEGDDIVRVMRAGKAEYYHTDDPLLLRALTAFNEVPTHPGVKPFVWAKQMLTAGATATPEFLMANGLRDTGEAWATSKHTFLPVVDTLRGAWQNVRESELTQDLMMAGSAFHSGYFHTGRNEDTAKAIARALRKGGLAQGAIEKHLSTLYNPKRWWDIYRSGMEASEMGSRILLAQRTMEAGGSFLEAAHEAKDFLDFSMRGDDRFVQFFTSVLPFLNARLQGGYRLARVGTTKGRRGKLAGRMALIAMASTSLYLWNMAMYAAGYEELDDYDKDAYWHIAPGTDHHVRIPKPFEIGLVAATFVERMLGAVQYQLTDGAQGDRPRETWESFTRGIIHTMAIDPLPQLVRPVLEVQTNVNRFFDSPIENMGDEGKAPEDRFNATTSDTMKAASRGMTWLAGDDKALSPKQLQHLWRGYTAGIGSYLLDASDWVLRQATDAPPRPDLALRDFPLIGRFARGGNPPSSTRYMDEFYTLRDQAKQQSDRVKQAVLDGETRKAERIEAEFGWLLGPRVDSKRAKGGFMHEGVRALGDTADMVSEMRKADQRVYSNPDQTPAMKRWMLDEYAKTRNDAVRKAVRQFNEAERRGSYKAPTPPREPSASSVPESRRAEYAGVGKGGTATVAPDVLKGARNAPTLVMVGDHSKLPSKAVRSFLDTGALGAYDPAERRAYVVMGLDPAVAKFVAYHEIAGHHGLQGALGEDYESTLNRAMQNPTVDRLAKAIQERAYASEQNRLAMTEEALSELAAARRTGDYARIESEWGITVPASAQPGLSGMMARVGQLTRRKLADLTGEEPTAFNDEQVYSLIEDAWRYVEKG